VFLRHGSHRLLTKRFSPRLRSFISIFFMHSNRRFLFFSCIYPKRRFSLFLVYLTSLRHSNQNRRRPSGTTLICLEHTPSILQNKKQTQAERKGLPVATDEYDPVSVRLGRAPVFYACREFYPFRKYYMILFLTPLYMCIIYIYHIHKVNKLAYYDSYINPRKTI